MDEDRRALARDEPFQLAIGDEATERDLDIGLAEMVGDEALKGVTGHRLEDGRIDLAVETDDRATLRRVRRERLDVGVDRCGTLVEVGLLLLGEIVVEPVDDDGRHEQECQRDDREERAGQAALEGPWQEPAQASRKTGSPLRSGPSARRMRNRHPERS